MRRSLPFDSAVEPLEDILRSIGRIERFLEDRTESQVANDEKTLFACQYALLVISEAAKRLGDEAEVLCPGQPWRDIRGIGNYLRHAYDSLDPAVIWRVFENDLPRLKSAVELALARLR